MALPGRIALASLVKDEDVDAISVTNSTLFDDGGVSGIAVAYDGVNFDFVFSGSPDLVGVDDIEQTLRVTFSDGQAEANSESILEFNVLITNTDDPAVASAPLPTVTITQDDAIADGSTPFVRVNLNDYFSDSEGFFSFSATDVAWTLTKVFNGTTYTLLDADNSVQVNAGQVGTTGQFNISGTPRLAISDIADKLSATDGDFTTNVSGQIDVGVTGATPDGTAGNTLNGQVFIVLNIDAAPITVTDAHANWDAGNNLFNIDGGLDRMTIDMNDYFADTGSAQEALQFTVDSTGDSNSRLSAFDADIEANGVFTGYIFGANTLTVTAEDSFHTATATFVIENYGEDISTLAF